MRLAQIVPRVSVHPELETYECRPCRQVTTKVVED
jgi:hypothetical protein